MSWMSNINNTATASEQEKITNDEFAFHKPSSETEPVFYFTPPVWDNPVPEKEILLEFEKRLLNIIAPLSLITPVAPHQHCLLLHRHRRRRDSLLRLFKGPVKGGTIGSILAYRSTPTPTTTPEASFWISLLFLLLCLRLLLLLFLI